MTHLIVGAVFFFACYGALTAIADVLRWFERRALRRRGHDPEFCDTCSGRERGKHVREVLRP